MSLTIEIEKENLEKIRKLQIEGLTEIQGKRILNKNKKNS